MGFWILTAAERSVAMLCAWSAWEPWEKFKRATSMPASSKRSMTRGERLAGPMVQTILECRNGMLTL